MWVPKKESSANLGITYSIPNFIDEELESLRQQVTSPKLPSKSGAELGLDLGPLERPLFS